MLCSYDVVNEHIPSKQQHQTNLILVKSSKIANLFNIDIYDRKNGALLFGNGAKMPLTNTSFEIVVDNSNNIKEVIFTIDASLIGEEIYASTYFDNVYLW